ncbi:MAG: acetyl-CoA carboxylase biotin carboxyl carrier protein [Alphaproteobacteria bacterium]|nr:acetyl-CoA carboxylase biotin carboxyl carrier protein [Marinicaulis sp.]NOX96238.1 acetyl-CoA carboxylase biotin carboxyl carrier protein [Alphaproteobacteria bacterium]
MSNKKNDHGHELEAAWIRELAAILEETGLTEVEIEKNSVRLRVSRQGGVAPMIAAPALAAAPSASIPSAPEAPAIDHPGAVRSPMVGTAFLAASPDADPFVTIGAQVSEGQTIMIIEAMKTMNTIAAPRSGKVVKILVNDAQPVEFDEPLLIIE